MKVHEIIATADQVLLTLAPENEAEIALVNLMEGCTAACDSNVEEPKNGLLVAVRVKAKDIESLPVVSHYRMGMGVE